MKTVSCDAEGCGAARRTRDVRGEVRIPLNDDNARAIVARLGRIRIRAAGRAAGAGVARNES